MIEGGAKPVIFGAATGAVMVNGKDVDLRPPLDTVMDAVPADVMKFAPTVAVSWVELTRLGEGSSRSTER